MKLSLIGYGKMGQLIHELALQEHHEIVSIIDPRHPQANYREINALSIEKADLCIEFSTARETLNHIKTLACLKKSVLVGTTGWDVDHKQLLQIAIQGQIGILFAPNFSIGVHLFSMLVEKAASLINPLQNYDIAISEAHHHKKKDAPSGTALHMAQSIIKNMERKKSVTTQSPQSLSELQISSQRLGSIFGEHQIIIDSDFDQILLKHTCKNRKSFAIGALKAALWLHSKVGFYSLDDMMKDIYQGVFL